MCSTIVEVGTQTKSTISVFGVPKSTNGPSGLGFLAPARRENCNIHSTSTSVQKGSYYLQKRPLLGSPATTSFNGGTLFGGLVAS